MLMLFMLPVYSCYLCIHVTCVFVLPVYSCYLCIRVTCVFVLPVYLCYLCIHVTCVFVLPVHHLLSVSQAVAAAAAGDARCTNTC